ncbi:acyl carrier protein [Rhizosaccharibacter radicis]|uniref:Acyl carrier protein n=1 Tax=Rhizosaccharibacter radicis TaxID=2782605 RepID=A0ABT1VWZ0_9PROT|nr:acyl carrier protein [Acetobacteraceae bacterium KSS12]
MQATEDAVQAIAEVVRSLKNPAIPQDLPIAADTTLAHDLKLDSLAVMDFVMALEQRFDTVISMDDLPDVQTVGDLARLLDAQPQPAASLS